MGFQVAANASECLRMCGVNPNCAWFSFDPAANRCSFTSTCFPIESGSSGGAADDAAVVVSGRAECGDEGGTAGL